MHVPKVCATTEAMLECIVSISPGAAPAASCETLTVVLDCKFRHVLCPTQEETKSSMCLTCLLKLIDLLVVLVVRIRLCFLCPATFTRARQGCRKCTLVLAKPAHHPLKKFDPLFRVLLPPPDLVIMKEACVGRRRGSLLKRQWIRMCASCRYGYDYLRRGSFNYGRSPSNRKGIIK